MAIVTDRVEEEARAQGQAQQAARVQQDLIEQLAATTNDPTAKLYALVNRLTRSVYTLVAARDPGRDTVSLGYSEVTLASARLLFEQLGVGPSTSFLDIGSGFGRLVLHAIIERSVPVTRAKGIEFEPLRHAQSRVIQAYAADFFERDDLRDARATLFEQGDVTERASLDYDVIFFYNVLSTPRLRDAVHRILVNSRFRLYADCFAPNARRWPYLEHVGSLEMINDGGERHTVYVYRPRPLPDVTESMDSTTGATLGITVEEALATSDTRLSLARKLAPDDWRGLYALQNTHRRAPMDEAERLAFDQLWEAQCMQRYGPGVYNAVANFARLRRDMVALGRTRALSTYWYTVFRLLSIVMRIGELVIFALLDQTVWVDVPETRRLDTRDVTSLTAVRDEARRRPLSDYALSLVADSPFIYERENQVGVVRVDEYLQARVRIDTEAREWTTLTMTLWTDGSGEFIVTLEELPNSQFFAHMLRRDDQTIRLARVHPYAGLLLLHKRRLWENAAIQRYLTEGLALLRDHPVPHVDALAPPYDWIRVLTNAALGEGHTDEALAFIEQGGQPTFYYGGRRHEVPVLYQHTSTI
jgi:hypothetical protein